MLLWVTGVAGVPAAQSQTTQKDTASGPARGGAGCPEASRVIREAAELFELGESAYKREGLEAARLHFDGAVDRILMSGCDVRYVPELASAYRMVVERVHAFEVDAANKHQQTVQDYSPTSADCLTEYRPAVPSAAVPIIWQAADGLDQPCGRAPEADSVSAVFKRLSVGIRYRGEFETTAEFQTYKERLGESLGVGSTTYCFEVYAGFEPFYSADSAEFSLLLSARSGPPGKKYGGHVLKLRNRDFRSPNWRAEVFGTSIRLTLAANPDVARQVKPLFGGYRYFVVGRVVSGREDPGAPPSWVHQTIPDDEIHFNVEALVIARGANRCVVARIQ